MKDRYDLDEVTLFSVRTMGVPGKRTFFLIIGQKDDWLRLWLEKEQLEAIGLAIRQFMITLASKHLYSPLEVGDESSSGYVPPGLPSAELEIDQIALGYESGRVILDFLVHPLGPESDEESEVTCNVTPVRLEKLGIEARKICAAGRPRCILCGGPIDPEGHVCPKTN